MPPSPLWGADRCRTLSVWEDFGSLLSHLRFARNYHRRIRRVAAVTDSSFLAILPRVANHFAAAEIRHFEYRKRETALAWLRGEQQES